MVNGGEVRVMVAHVASLAIDSNILLVKGTLTEVLVLPLPPVVVADGVLLSRKLHSVSASQLGQ
jgi:hypothetical protein